VLNAAAISSQSRIIGSAKIRMPPAMSEWPGFECVLILIHQAINERLVFGRGTVVPNLTVNDHPAPDGVDVGAALATMLADIDGNVVTTVNDHGSGAASTRCGCPSSSR
jgi:hypothetical protein